MIVNTFGSTLGHISCTVLSICFLSVNIDKPNSSRARIWASCSSLQHVLLQFTWAKTPAIEPSKTVNKW